MRIWLFVLLCFASLEIHASEHYQLKNSVGFWKSWEFPWNESTLEIKLEWNGISIRYCDPLEVEINGVCEPNRPWYGSGYYNSIYDGFEMTELSSPHGRYILRVHKRDTGTLQRVIGKKVIDYLRVLVKK